MVRIARTALLMAAGALLVSGPAWGLPQTKEQGKCINQINKFGLKVHETQGKDHYKCVKDFGGARLIAMTGEQCLTADRKGKVAKALGKTIAKQAKFFCTTSAAPDFGYTSAVNANAVNKQAEIDLMHDLFGSPVDGGPTDGLFECNPYVNECKCQRYAVNRIMKLTKIIPRTFGKCKKAALKLNDEPFPAGAASAAELQECWENPLIPVSVVSDPASKIAGVVGLLTSTLADQCDATGVTSVSFSGVCDGLSGNLAKACIVSLVKCRACKIINAMDGLSADCNTYAGMICPP